MKELKAEAKAKHSAKLAGFKGKSSGIANGKPFYGDDVITSDAKETEPQKIPTRKHGGKVVDMHGEEGRKRLDKAPRRKSGGPVFEGSAKDVREDKILAKKHHETMKEWEHSKGDEKHDRQRSMKGLREGGRTARADGGRVKGKGKTNVTIVIGAGQPGGLGQPPQPPEKVPVPIPVPAGGPTQNPGLQASQNPGPIAAGPGMAPPPMMRKKGGRISSPADLTAGAMSGEGRLQKTELQRNSKR